MVEQNRSGAYTEIVYGPHGGKLALMNGQTLQKAFVPLAGGAVAVYTSAGVAYYRHSDWLGSSRFASTPTRTMDSDGAYAPFGEPYAQSGTADLSFTGMNQDTVTGLYDFAAREYATQGRWPSPDPSGIASVLIKDPQTWNRYAYVENDPINAADPSGLMMIAPSAFWFLGFGGGGIGDSWNEFDIMMIPVQIGTLYQFTGTLNYDNYNFQQLLNFANENEISLTITPIYGDFIIMGDGGGQGIDFGQLKRNALIALLNPDCAELFGGIANAVTSLFSSTYDTYNSGQENPYPSEISSGAWEQHGVPSLSSPNNYGWTSWTTLKPGGHIFFNSTFPGYAPGFPETSDGVSQMTGFLHEQEHAANHNEVLDIAIDAPDARSADYQKINKKCTPKQVETQSAPISSTLTPPE